MYFDVYFRVRTVVLPSVVWVLKDIYLQICGGILLDSVSRGMPGTKVPWSKVAK